MQRYLESPETFEVPDLELKKMIQPGDLVKLVWSVARSPGERMWVRVTHRHGGRLMGNLEDQPLSVDMHPGEQVAFVIDDIIDCQLIEATSEEVPTRPVT